MSKEPDDTPERLRLVLTLFDRALDLPTGERDAFVRREAEHDPPLQEQLLRMLQSVDDPTPAWLALAEGIEDQVVAAQFQRSTGEEREVALSELLRSFPSQREGILSLVARLDALVADMRRRLGVVWELSRGHHRYELLERLGEGGLGAVFAARDHLLGRRIAYKTIHAEKRGARLHEIEPSIVHRFLDEAEIAARLQHPGIPPVHDLGIGPEGVPFYTMRWIRGRSLAEELEAQGGRWRQPLANLTRVVLRIAEAVAYAHTRGVLHRDLKPHNVMIGRFGEVCVVDWGLARAAMAAGEDDGRLCVDRRVDLMTGGAGSEGYMAPEQLRGRFSEQGDVFSVAAMLHTLLTGARPLVAWGAEARVELSPALAKCDARLAFVCRRGLAVDPQQRWAGMAALRDALAAVLAKRDPEGWRSSPLGLLAGGLRSWWGGLRGSAGLTDPSKAQATPSHLPGPSRIGITHGSRRSGSAARQRTSGLSEQLQEFQSLCSPPGRYEIQGLLGRGGMADVFDGMDLLLRRNVAMKRVGGSGVVAGDAASVMLLSDGTVPATARPTEDLTARLLDDAQIQAQLEHPSILPVHEILVSKDAVPSFVMMQASAESLATSATGGSRWREPVEWLLQAAWALAYAHRKGVVHRDVKPANILLGGHGDAYLADWGLAVLTGAGEGQDSKVTVRRGGRDVVETLVDEEPGQFAGTPGYMAPECVKGRISRAGDVWAIGATLFQVLVGRSLFAALIPTALSTFEVLDATATIRVAPRLIRARNRAIPRRVAEVCARCLQQDPMRRYPDAEAFARALQAALA